MPSLIIIYGPTRAGKSYLIKWLLKSYMHRWSYGMVICPNNDPAEYDYVPQEYVHRDGTDDAVWALRKLQEGLIATSDKPHDYQSFLVLDDCAGIMRFDSRQWVSLFVSARHLRMTIIVSIQYAAKLSMVARLNADYAFIFPQQGESAYRLLYEAYGGEKWRSWKEFQLWISSHCVDHRAALYTRAKKMTDFEWATVRAPPDLGRFRLAW